jgi:glyoxalase/bleomycin resistance protein/dioxygenase superfamily protein
MTVAGSPAMKALAPVLVVDAVEPCVQFWTERLGFTKENEVPGNDGTLVFASVKKGTVEIMYQTRASVVADSPSQASELDGRSAVLFITVPTVADLDSAERAVADAPVVKARHKTFYGSEEFYVREPGGTVVGFAAF